MDVVLYCTKDRLNSNIFVAVMHFAGEEMKAMALEAVVLQNLHSGFEIEIFSC